MLMHPKLVMGIATLLACGGMLIASYMTTWPWFVVFYVVPLALATGLSYVIPMVIGWSYFPKHTGRVAGIVVSGFGFSGAIFSIVTAYIINPDNMQPDITVSDGEVTNHYYSEEIANGVPSMLRWMCLIWLIFGIIATVLIQPIKKTEGGPAKSTVGYP